MSEKMFEGKFSITALSFSGHEVSYTSQSEQPAVDYHVHCENDIPIANMERNLRVKASRALPRHRDVAPIPNIDAVEDRLSGAANTCECCCAKDACRLRRKSRDSASDKAEVRCEGALRSCGTAGYLKVVVALPAPALERFTPSQLTFAISRLSAKEKADDC
jgi:hypothetical protein